jgi:hypothetical protein
MPSGRSIVGQFSWVTHRPLVGRLVEILGLVTLVAIACRIRWPLMIHRSLWLDELTTAWAVGGSWVDVVPRSLLGNLSPVYFWMVWSATRLFGYNEIGLRLPSLVAGLLVIPAIYYVTKALTVSPLAGAAAALLTTFDGDFIDYSVEARPYSMVQLFAVSNIGLFMAWRKTGRRAHAVLLTLNAALLFYMHYTAALFLAVNVLLVLLSWTRSPGPTKRELCDIFVSTLLFVVASSAMAYQLWHLFTIREAFDSFVHPLTPDESVTRFNVVRYLLIPLAFGIVVSYLIGLSDIRPEPSAWASFVVVACLLWYVAPPLAAWCLAKVNVINVNLPRYLIATSTACVMLSVTAIRYGLPRRAAMLTLLFLMAGDLWLCRDAFARFQDTHQRGGWRAVVSRVNESAIRDVTTYVHPGLIEARWIGRRRDPIYLDYLLCPINSAYRLRPDLLKQAIPVSGPLGLPDIREADRFLYIGYWPDLDVIERRALDRNRPLDRSVISQPVPGKLPVAVLYSLHRNTERPRRE